MRHSSAVDEDVERPVLAGDSREGRVNRVLSRHVARHMHGNAVCIDDVAHALVRGEIEDGDAGAATGEENGDRLPNARAATRDDGGAAFQRGGGHRVGAHAGLSAACDISAERSDHRARTRSSATASTMITPMMIS